MDMWDALCDYLDSKMRLLQVRTGTRTDNLAQASEARLSKTGRGSPKPSARAVAQAGGPCFERENASLGEESSPKRASAIGPYSRLSSSRLGKGSSPERESLSPKRELWA